MKKAEEKKEKKICGKTIRKIRRAFFKNELGKLLAEIQIDKDIEKEDLEELNDYLGTLKSRNDEIIDEATRLFGGEIVGVKLDAKPPTVEELRGGASDKEWREKADKVRIYIQKEMDNARMNIKNKKKMPGTYWLDIAVNFLSYQYLIDRDLAYKDMLYRARMTEIIDKYHISRKEAEERAKLTTEYADYKEVKYLKERISEFIMLCKKYDAYEREVE